MIPFLFLNPLVSQAFDGGVGGLGKTKPSTGVVFRDPDSSQSAFSTSDSSFSNELLAPDGTAVLVSFSAPWPLLRTSSSIESRAITNPDSAFILVAPFTSSSTKSNGNEDVFTKAFFLENVFGSQGKFGRWKNGDRFIDYIFSCAEGLLIIFFTLSFFFSNFSFIGAYGAPSDVKVKTINRNLYAVTFTTLTPAMRESDRKVYISTNTIGEGVFMLVTGSTAVRFSNTEKTLREVADSFRVTPAPKTNLR